MPATPRDSTLALFLRPGLPRFPLTFLLFFAPFGAAFLAIDKPPVYHHDNPLYMRVIFQSSTK
jgi:hypothetical protein